MIIGIDKGSAYTKAGKFCTRSTVRELSEDINIRGLKTTGTIITINDKNYVIGDTGEYATNLLKSKQDTTKILVYTAIAFNMWREFQKVYAVVGLPIGQYNKQKEDMIKLIKTPDVVRCSIAGTPRHFTIDGLETYPECAGAFIASSNSKLKLQNVLIIDIGGLSVDIILFVKGRIKKYTTYELGIMPLYNKLANYINMTYNTKLSLWDTENVLKEGLFINGEQVNDIQINLLIKQHAHEITSQINMDYDMVGIQSILLTGGGGDTLHPYINKIYKRTTLLPESFLSNVHGFQQVAEVIYANK